LVEDVMDKQKVKIIQEYMLEHPNVRASELKMALGDDFSSAEIRIIGASLVGVSVE
jgi:hypothetical protein